MPRCAALPLLASAACPAAGAACEWADGEQPVGGVLEDRVGVAGRDGCCARCAAEPNCAAATYHAALRRCVLRTGAGGAAACAGCATARVRAVAQQGGHFGRWAADANGLPTYVYTCDQTTDPAALGVPSLNPMDRGATEHIFQIGNSRVTLVANNYGAFRLRQDEGGSKWLLGANDVPAGDLSAGTQHGAGYGYLRGADGSAVLSSYYTGGERAREFGVGFVRSNVTAGGWAVSHTVAVPPGDDPVAVVEVRVTNTGAAPRSAAWQEVVGSRMVHMDYFATLGLSDIAPELLYPRLTERRLFTNTHYRSNFTRLGGGLHGVRHSREYLGLSAADERAFLRLMAKGGFALPLAPNASAWDESPPEVFVAALPGAAAGARFGTDAARFFAGGGVRDPRGAVEFAGAVREQDAAVIAEVPLRVDAGATEVLCFLVGYLPPDRGAGPTFSAAALARKYAGACGGGGGAVAHVAGLWRGRLLDFSAAAAPALAPEMAWHSYYLLAGTSYDDYFAEHIIDQGMSYRYAIGFQGAARDPAQHALGYLMLDPGLARSVLRYTLKEQRPSLHSADPLRPVDVPYAIMGHGIALPGLGLGVPIFGAVGRGNKPSDMELYVLLLAAEYLLTTRDAAVLSEEITYYNSTATHTVLDALCRMLRFVTRTVGAGPHGIMRMLTSDWDDQLGPPAEAYNVSESVFNAAIATYALPRFAAALRMAGVAADVAAEADAFAAAQAAALAAGAWDAGAGWLRRAWLGEQKGWVGAASGEHKGMYSAQHGWALLSGALRGDPAKEDAVVAGLTSQCRNGWNYGFAYACAQKGTLQSSEGAGMWPAIDHPVVLGLAAANRTELAWEEFVRNSLHWQASVTPREWSGVWSSADEVSAGGGTGPVGMQFPALCMHRHAWPLVSAARLAGVVFDEHGVLLAPALPLSLGATSFAAPAASLRWDPAAGRYDGHFAPPRAAAVRVAADLSARHPGRAARLTVRAGGAAGGVITATGTGRVAVPTLPPSRRIEFSVQLL